MDYKTGACGSVFNLLEDYTGMKLPEDKDFVFRDMMVGFSDKYNIVRCSMTVRQISTGQSALINSQCFANEVKDGEKLGAVTINH